MRRTPVARHPLAAIEPSVFFFCPCLVIAKRLKIGLGAPGQIVEPGRLERGAGLVERVGGAAALLAGIAARVEIAAATDNWRDLFEHAMVYTDQLNVEDQITIMQYIFDGNRRIVNTLRFQQWMTMYADAILDHLEKSP
jgi:hypothetical protein